MASPLADGAVCLACKEGFAGREGPDTQGKPMVDRIPLGCWQFAREALRSWWAAELRRRKVRCDRHANGQQIDLTICYFVVLQSFVGLAWRVWRVWAWGERLFFRCISPLHVAQDAIGRFCLPGKKTTTNGHSRLQTT